MKVYVVMVDDRHTDTEPYVFSKPEDALAFARETARGWLVEQDPPDGNDWLFLAEHPTEDDAVWVIETRMTHGRRLVIR